MMTEVKPTGEDACRGCGHLIPYRQYSEAWGRGVYENLSGCGAGEDFPEDGGTCRRWYDRQAAIDQAHDQEYEMRAGK